MITTGVIKMESIYINSLYMGYVEDLNFFRFEIALSRLVSSKACLAQQIRSFFRFSALYRNLSHKY